MLHQGATRLLPAIVGTVFLCSLPAAGAEVEAKAKPGIVAAVAQGDQAPAAPTLNLVFNLNHLHLSWIAASGATYYKIYQNPDGASGFTAVDGNITATSHDREVAVQQPNWSAGRYLLEACNAAGCTASKEVAILGAVLQAIGYFKAFDTEARNTAGISLALSVDGDTLAVGAPDDSSAAIGVGGDQAPSLAAANSGAVHIFTHQGSTWSQQAYLKASNTSAGDSFGNSVSLSSDGKTLAVGAYLEDSPGRAINGNQGSIADNNSNAGAVYVFSCSGGNWSQQAYVKASNAHANAYFGSAVSLNGDGDTLAVGAIGEHAGGLNAGAVYVFTRSARVWSQQAYVKPSNIRTNAYFGSSVTLNINGTKLAVGAQGESRGGAGHEGNQSDNTNSGAVYVFTRSATVWSQRIYVRAPNTAAGDGFGSPVSWDGDSGAVAGGRSAKASSRTGNSDNQTDSGITR